VKATLTTRWLVAASSTLVVLFLFLASIAYENSRRAEEDSALISLDAVPGSIAAHQLRVATSSYVRNLAQAVLTEDPAVRATSLARTGLARDDFLHAVAQYERTMRIDPGQDRVLLDNLGRGFAELRAMRANLDQLIDAGNLAGARAYFEAEVMPSFTPLNEAADALLAYNQANTVTLADSIARRSRNLRATTLVALGMSLLCGAVLAINVLALRRERRAADAEERRLREILDNLGSLIGLCDIDGRIIEVNETALRASGVTRERLVGKLVQTRPWRTDNPGTHEQLQACIRRAAGGSSCRTDLEFRTTDGNTITLDFSCAPVRDETGNIRHLIISGIDVSERDKLRLQLLKAQRLEAIGTLSSGLAHDLNNILTPMLIAAGLLKSKVTEPRDLKVLTMIETGVLRGASIIRQLLAFGRGNKGPLGNVQLRHLVKDVAQIIQETFPRNIEFAYVAPPTLHPISGDPTQLHQLMLNLCLNARDAMPNGGKLTVTAENTELSDEDTRLHPPAKPGPYVKLVVTDTGVGMSPEVLERIFNPFFSTKAPGKGTGLGLSSVLSIAKGHGGFVTVDSAPGEGSTFVVCFPATHGAVTAEFLPATDTLPRGNGETILVVDDEPAIRQAVGEVLEAHNYRVVTAGNGDEAVRLFVQHRETIKLVLCDIQMPVMGGAELVRGLRVLEPKLKFVIMTGSSHGERRRALGELGAVDIVDKPCASSKLLELLHERLAPAGGNDGSDRTVGEDRLS
jgi:two-component system cell cycle sensor histidine kinase/response regulator CckA